MAQMPTLIAEFLSGKRIAVAGVSRGASSAANPVYRKLRDWGYEVFPIHYLARTLYYAQRKDEAIAEERRILEMDPNFFPAHNLLGMMLLERGEKEEGLAELRKALELSHGALISLASLWICPRRDGPPR